MNYFISLRLTDGSNLLNKQSRVDFKDLQRLEDKSLKLSRKNSAPIHFFQKKHFKLKKNLGLCSQHPLGPNYSVKTIDLIDPGGGASEPLNLLILLHWYKVDNNLNDRLGSREREFSFT